MKIFIEEYAENKYQKLVPGLYLILVNGQKYRQCVQETLFVYKIF